MRADKLDRLSDFSLIQKSHPYYLVYKPLLRDIQLAIGSYASGNVLDIGCGNKPYEKMFHGLIESYIGCDVIQSSESKVDVISEATNIPLADSSFDTIFSTQVIEHVGDHDKMLKEAFRLCKPGGCVIMSGPMYWPLHEEPHDYFRFTKYGFQLIFERAGFKILEIKANGGSWALLGQVILQTFPALLVNRQIFRWLINSIFGFLDNRRTNTGNTMNYVIIARK